MSSVLSATERAQAINLANDPGGFKLVEDAAHWVEYGIETGEQLDHYLAWCDYVNLYKDVHGIKPRWVDPSGLSTDKIQQMTQGLEEDIARENARTREVEAKVAAILDPTPLTHNPFVALLGGSSS